MGSRFAGAGGSLSEPGWGRRSYGYGHGEGNVGDGIEKVGAGGRKEGIRTPFPAGTCKWGAVNRVTRLVGYPGTFTGD